MNDNFRRPIAVPADADTREAAVAANRDRAIAIFPLLSYYLGVIRRRKWSVFGHSGRGARREPGPDA